MISKLVPTLLAILCMAVPLNAAQKYSGEIVVGPGAATCGKYFSENQKMKSSFFFWAQGYLTAIFWAMESSSILAQKDPEALNLWLDNFCKDNPLKSYHEAVKALVKELMLNEGK